MLGVEFLEQRRMLAGDMFADAVIEYLPGDGVAEEHRNPASALGPPDGESPHPPNTIVSLGEGGRLSLLFVDEVIVDGRSWDLWVDEAGSSDTGYYYVSSDGGKTWHAAGRFVGDAYIDLGRIGVSEINAIRVIDAPPSGGADTPGVDIDAVVARHVASDYHPGDADRNGRFDTADIVQALQANKYDAGVNATWGEGDWNDDGYFNRLDIVAALETGTYLQPVSFRNSL